MRSRAKKLSGTAKIRRNAIYLSKQHRVRDYLFSAIAAADNQPVRNDIMLPRACAESMIARVQCLRGDQEGDTITIKTSDFNSCVTALCRTRDALPPEPPGIVFNFREGWMRETDHAGLWIFRKNQVKLGVNFLMRHLVGNLDVASLKVLCSGDCKCVVQQGPAGDRGGIPRRAPCGREETKHLPWMTPTVITYVSE